MAQGKRLVAATLISTLSTVPLFLLACLLSGDLGNQLLVPALLIAPVIAFIGVLLVGLPTHFVLVRSRLSHALAYAMPGFIIPVIFVVLVKPFGDDTTLWLALQAVQSGLFGVVVALVFRHVALGNNSQGNNHHPA